MFRKTERYISKAFKIHTFSKEKNGIEQLKITTYWLLFIPIYRKIEVINQDCLRRR